MGEGLDQAVLLLVQNADFVFLVTPRPPIVADAAVLEELVKKHVPHVGLIYAEHNGEFQEVLVPPKKQS